MKKIKNNKCEVGFLLTTVFILMVFIVVNAVDRNCVGMVINKKITNAHISNTIITVQATVMTLSIAILTLVSNRNNEDYLGIDISDYILNKKSIILTYKNTIAVSFFLLFFNIALKIYKQDLLIIGLFIASCVIVFYLIINIYNGFANHEIINEEISGYIENTILKKTGSSRRNYLEDFFDNLKKDSISDYSRKQREGFFFEKIFDVFFNSQIQNDDRECLEEGCINYLHYLKENDKTHTFLVFIQRCYLSMYQNINENTISKGVKTISILSSVGDDIYEIFNAGEISEFNKTFDWVLFVRNVSLVSAYYHNSLEQDSIIHFGYIIGKYCVRHNNDVLGEQITTLFRRMRFANYVEVFDESQKNIYTIISKKMLLRLSKVIILNNRIDIIKTDVFDEIYRFRLNDGFESSNKQMALFAIEIHTFLFYIAFYETTNCVSQKIKDECVKILKEIRVKNIFKTAFFQIADNDINIMGEGGKGSLNIFNTNLVETVFNDLSPLDISPISGNYKEYVMEKAVDDYIVFLFTYIANVYSDASIIKNSFEKEKGAAYYYIKYFDKRNISRYKKLYFCFVSTSATDEKTKNDIKVSYGRLQNAVEEFEKEEVLSGRGEDEVHKISEEEKRKMEKELIQFLNLQLGDLQLSDGEKDETINAKLLTINGFSNRDLSGYIRDTQRFLVNSFAGIVCYQWKKNDCLNEKNIKGMDENKYINYLQENSGKIFVGSSLNFMIDEHSDEDQVNKYLKTQKRSFEENYAYGLIMDRESAVNVDDVTIDIRPQTMEEMDIEFDEERDKYKYEVSQGIYIYVTKEELKKYLNDRIRVIEINAKIEMSKDVKGIRIIK